MQEKHKLRWHDGSDDYDSQHFSAQFEVLYMDNSWIFKTTLSGKDCYYPQMGGEGRERGPLVSSEVSAPLEKMRERGWPEAWPPHGTPFSPLFL